MGNCFRRPSVQPADSFELASLEDFILFVNHNGVVLQRQHNESDYIKLRYVRLDVPSWRSALQQTQRIVEDGCIVRLVFNAFLQVPSIADMLMFLPAARHVRSIEICAGCTGVQDAVCGNFAALAQFAESLDGLEELSAAGPTDFDWSLLGKEAFLNLRKLKIRAINDDGDVLTIKRVRG